MQSCGTLKQPRSASLTDLTVLQQKSDRFWADFIRATALARSIVTMLHAESECRSAPLIISRYYSCNCSTCVYCPQWFLLPQMLHEGFLEKPVPLIPSDHPTWPVELGHLGANTRTHTHTPCPDTLILCPPPPLPTPGMFWPLLRHLRRGRHEQQCLSLLCEGNRKGGMINKAVLFVTGEGKERKGTQCF